jgi:hypothetical protein
MAKKKKRRSRKHHSASRRRNYRRSNPSRMMFLAAPRRTRHRARKHHSRRKRNPSTAIRQFASGGLLKMVGGAAVGFLGSNAIPSLIPQLAQYNVGFMGYGIQALTGLGLAWGVKKVLGPQAGYGVLIGTGLSLLLRIVKEHAMTTGSTAAAAMSGDLAYYVEDRFPFAQGAGGPYANFPGTPSLANPPFPATSAAAVRAGAAAAAAALPAAPAMHGIGTGRWGVTSSGDASRWN